MIKTKPGVMDENVVATFNWEVKVNIIKEETCLFNNIT